MSTSALLDTGASQNFIAAPQATNFSNNFQKSLLCSAHSMEVHLADNSSVISHRIVRLPLQLLMVQYMLLDFGLFLH